MLMLKALCHAITVFVSSDVVCMGHLQRWGNDFVTVIIITLIVIVIVIEQW